MSKIFEKLKEDKTKLKLAVDINSALQERNYIKEFPETVDFLINRIWEIFDDADPEKEVEEDGSIRVSIFDENSEFNGWGIRFYDSEVYATKDIKGDEIDLFKPSDIADPKLRSLVFEEVDIADEWLKKLFKKIKGV
jgi:hypothetical protein